MEFLSPVYFLGLLVLPAVFFLRQKALPFSKQNAKKLIIKGKIPKKTKFLLLCVSYLLFITALVRPVVNNGVTTVKAPAQNIIIALDISKEMDKNDFYPDRFEFAKKKIKELLTYLNAQSTALILFDKNSYLVSPPSSDYESLVYLLNHTDIKELKRSATSDIPSVIKAAQKFSKDSKTVLFTYHIDTTGKNIYYYLCSKTKTHIPMVFNAEYSNESVKALAKELNKTKQKDIKIKNRTELFYYPMGLGILIFLFVLFFPLRRIK